MPTGYTANLTTESGFREFVLSVARGFGALMHMRDEPADAPLTLPEPITFYAEQLAEAQAFAAELAGLDEAGKEAKAKAAYDEASTNYENWCQQAAEKRAAYRGMLAKVEAWQAPSPGHTELKADMIRQLTESDRWDNNILDSPNLKPVRQTGAEWFAAALASNARDLTRYAEEDAKQQRLGAQRRQWVLDLQASLPA